MAVHLVAGIHGNVATDRQVKLFEATLPPYTHGNKLQDLVQLATIDGYALAESMLVAILGGNPAVPTEYGASVKFIGTLHLLPCPCIDLPHGPH